MLLNVGTGLMLSARGLAPRALRDIKAATCAGRFDVADPDLALALAAGALLGRASCCTTSPSATTLQPVTRWLRTCCVSTAFPHTRPKRFAAVHFQ